MGKTIIFVFDYPRKTQDVIKTIYILAHNAYSVGHGERPVRLPLQVRLYTHAV